MTEIKYLTKRALQEFKKELNHLENVERKEIAETLKHTASFGDLKENAAYHEAKEAQAFLEGRILKLKEIIASAQIIDNNINSKGKIKVQIGSIVVLQSGSKKERFQIVESEESNPLKGKISYQSPLGKAVLGKIKGKKIRLKTEEETKEYKILEIR